MQVCNEKGLSLVELMISLAIGSLITAGVVQLYTANSATYSLVMGQSRMQESARFALAFISRDVQRAGHRGTAGDRRPGAARSLPAQRLRTRRQR